MTCARGCCASPAEHYRSIYVDRKGHYESEKNKFAELDLYARAVKEGSQPWGTSTKQSLQALNESDRLGRPFRADDMGGTYHPEWKKELTGKPPISRENKGQV